MDIKKLIIVLCFVPSICFSASTDYYDWSTRVDRDGKPAGIFTVTPFPITESSTEYTITNDEGAKTFSLGTKLYVAKTGSNAGANNCQTFATPCLTIAYAITQTSAATNQTIIVRDGTYTESGLGLKTGAGDTTRSMLVGYGQERPVIDGNNGETAVIGGTGAANAYATIQRVKVQNNKETCIYFGSSKDAYFNLIDVDVYNCANNTTSFPADGNIYYYNADYGWIYHVTSSHTMGHCLKAGDGTGNTTIEWSKAYECGYWSTMVADKGITNWASSPGSHPSGIDLPNDDGIEGPSNTVRYNIVYDTLFYGMQVRNVSSFSVHHNEIYNTPHFDDVPGAASGIAGSPQLALLEYGGCFLSGSAYSNVIRDSSDATSSGIGINGPCNDRTVNVYNNIIYNNPLAELYLYGYPKLATRHINIWNNSVYHNNSTTPVIESTNNDRYAAGEVTILGNILHQAGAGAVLSLDPDITVNYNLYYYPSGSLGFTPGANDISGSDPLWVSTPPWSGYSSTVGKVQSGSPAKDALPTASAPTSTFTKDFNLTTRPRGSAWDIGAYELTGYIPSLSGATLVGGRVVGE